LGVGHGGAGLQSTQGKKQVGFRRPLLDRLGEDNPQVDRLIVGWMRNANVGREDPSDFELGFREASTVLADTNGFADHGRPATIAKPPEPAADPDRWNPVRLRRACPDGSAKYRRQVQYAKRRGIQASHSEPLRTPLIMEQPELEQVESANGCKHVTGTALQFGEIGPGQGHERRSRFAPIPYLDKLCGVAEWKRLKCHGQHETNDCAHGSQSQAYSRKMMRREQRVPPPAAQPGTT
jgi:hypothetical protein